MQEARDFQAEAETLHRAIAALPEAGFATRTAFKGWTIGDVIGHLYMFDTAAALSALDEGALQTLLKPVLAAVTAGQSLIHVQRGWLAATGDLSGGALRDAWLRQAGRLAEIYDGQDPKRRLKWAGPTMSARSMITARQMETWAHGQAVFDILGRDRVESDRVRNICHLGVSTFGWTHHLRKMPVPDTLPFVRLTAPSGALWTWGEARDDERVEGEAVAFAQVTAQTRNIADTDLRVTGPISTFWMHHAQCFAGALNDPPAPGTRRKAE